VYAIRGPQAQAELDMLENLNSLDDSSAETFPLLQSLLCPPPPLVYTSPADDSLPLHTTGAEGGALNADQVF
jgi:hypothetical protein